jgi:hypothetical protein
MQSQPRSRRFRADFKPGTVVRVKYDYSSPSENTLDLTRGENVVVLPVKLQYDDVQTEPFWIAGSKANGERGYFPSTYVDILDDGVFENPEEGREGKLGTDEKKYRGMRACESVTATSLDCNPSSPSNMISAGASLVDRNRNTRKFLGWIPAKLFPYDRDNIRGWIKGQAEEAVLNVNRTQLLLSLSAGKELGVETFENNFWLEQLEIESKLQNAISLALSKETRTSLDIIVCEAHAINYTSPSIATAERALALLDNEEINLLNRVMSPRVVRLKLENDEEDIIQMNTIFRCLYFSHGLPAPPLKFKELLGQIRMIESIYSRLTPRILVYLHMQYEPRLLLPVWSYAACEDIIANLLEHIISCTSENARRILDDRRNIGKVAEAQVTAMKSSSTAAGKRRKNFSAEKLGHKDHKLSQNPVVSKSLLKLNLGVLILMESVLANH